jgi:hypothetical protein
MRMPVRHASWHPYRKQWEQMRRHVQRALDPPLTLQQAALTQVVRA